MRGLSADARCPECGELAAQWHRVPALVNADARWLRTLAVGLLLISAGMGVWHVLFQLFIWAPALPAPFPHPLSIAGRPLPDVLGALPSLAMLAGVLLLTTRPPTPTMANVGAGWRIGGRLLMLLRTLVWGLLYLAKYGEDLLNRHVMPAPYLFSAALLPRWVSIVCESLGLAVIVALGLYASRLARIAGRHWCARLLVLTVAISATVHGSYWLIFDILPYVDDNLLGTLSPQVAFQILTILFGLQGLLVVLGSIWMAQRLWQTSRVP